MVLHDEELDQAYARYRREDTEAAWREYQRAGRQAWIRAGRPSAVCYVVPRGDAEAEAV